MEKLILPHFYPHYVSLLDGLILVLRPLIAASPISFKSLYNHRYVRHQRNHWRPSLLTQQQCSGLGTYRMALEFPFWKSTLANGDRGASRSIVCACLCSSHKTKTRACDPGRWFAGSFGRLREFNVQNWPTGLKPMSRAVRASMQLVTSRLWFLLERNRRCVEPRMALVKLVCVFMA